jgi:LacI family transcriptional regulator
MADIAQRCGVSKFSVSHALRGSTGQVSEETRGHILAVAREMGYDPSRNQAARRLALQKHGVLAQNHAIGVALPEGLGNTTYYGQLLDGVIDVMAGFEYGVHVTLLQRLVDPLPRACGRGEIDGLVSAIGSLWFRLWVQRLREEPNFGDRPIIAIIDPVSGCSSVHADDYQAGYLVASHLLDMGHLHIAHQFDSTVEVAYGVSPDPDSATKRRLEGIFRAYHDRGLDPVEFTHHIRQPQGACEEQQAVAAEFMRQLTERPEITAICAANDFTAVRLWKLFAHAGVRVPEDVSLISFDDTHEILSPTGENFLTTVRIPLYDIGCEGARLLIRAISGEVRGVQNVVMPVELITRQSTTPPRNNRSLHPVQG